MIVARHAIQLGTLLTILGIGTFAVMAGFMPGSWMTLQPAAFGIVFLGLGILALKREVWQRPLILAAIALAFAVIIRMAPCFLEAYTLLRGGDVSQPATALQQSITALVCLSFIGRSATFLLATRK